jgi:hypothetical protein
MAQLIACHNNHGIVLAADSKALDFNDNGQLIDYTVDRLVQLGKHAAILAGGAAQAAHMAKALKSFVESEGLSDIEDIYQAALPFLGSEYARFLRHKCQEPELDPLMHVYFILAGYTARSSQQPRRVYFLWTKKKLPQLDGDEISNAFTVPRRMGLEYNLNQLAKSNAAIDEILAKIKDGLETLGRNNEEVGKPFAYAVLTQYGLERIG